MGIAVSTNDGPLSFLLSGSSWDRVCFPFSGSSNASSAIVRGFFGVQRGGVAFLWKECDIQEVSYKLVIYIRISKTLSIVVSVTNKINNFIWDSGGISSTSCLLFHQDPTRSWDNHQLSQSLPVSLVCLHDRNVSTTEAESIKNFAALRLFQAHLFFRFCINSHGWHIISYLGGVALL